MQETITNSHNITCGKSPKKSYYQLSEFSYLHDHSLKINISTSIQFKLILIWGNSTEHISLEQTIIRALAI